ncbi:hypothetical protein PAV_109p00760 (plasmid) [Paenibacillus alvei DSM 29]|nr:hypothetical protein PAV_109p00760 [Paenibacillus alvei DSM 29]
MVIYSSFAFRSKGQVQMIRRKLVFSWSFHQKRGSSMEPKFLIMYEHLGEDKPKFHILFNELSSKVKLYELENEAAAQAVRLFEIKEISRHNWS